MAEGEGGVREGRGRERMNQPGLRLIKREGTGKQARLDLRREVLLSQFYQQGAALCQ